MTVKTKPPPRRDDNNLLPMATDNRHKARSPLADIPLTTIDRIIRKDELPAFTGLRRSVIAEMIADNEFPKPEAIQKRPGDWMADV
jgi:predicted DNA-binding transcriptional regulator AlpA